jgi:threonyl-tRNA synthetase
VVLDVPRSEGYLTRKTEFVELAPWVACLFRRLAEDWIVELQLVYPDGTVAHHPSGVTGSVVAGSIGARLAKAAVAVALDGELLDLGRPLTRSGKFEVITENTEIGRHIARHSAAHILAQAVLDLFPGAHFAIGPAIEDGFYYDFDIGRPFTPDDLERLSDRMSEIVAADQPFQREAVGREQALALFADQPFKREIIEGVDPSEVADDTEVTVYRNLAFVDLCRGPHLPSTGRLRAFKLLRTAGAYWRGDEKRGQLQRIYGTAWESQAALDAYVTRMEEAERRDHRRLGPELDLFSFPRDLGVGLAVWHPKGGMVRKLIEDHSRRLHERYGFDFVFTPHLAKEALWETSGHLDYYAENMSPGMELDEGDRYRVKPMNCPGHILIYRSRGRSYRDLPLRFSELGGVYRNERSGVVHGLLRARGFTQDDSHTFCRPDQIDDELALHLEFVLTWLRDFGFAEFEAELSTRPEKAVGDLAMWEVAQAALQKCLEDAGVSYRVAEGEGAFYGPKIDVHVKDAIGRRWQMSTIQFDFNEPHRFELEYATSDNQSAQPIMIHCAKAGSVERFAGILTEHYAGAFPLWLAPVQVTVIPVADRHDYYARTVAGIFREKGLRAEIDGGDDTVGEKIRRALSAKHPVLCVVGDKDMEARTVGLRRYGEERESRGVPLEDVAATLAKEARPPASTPND